MVDDACRGVVRVYSERGNMLGAGSGFGIGVPGEETDTFITNMHVVGDPETGKLCDKVYIMLDDEAVKMEDGGGSWIPDYDHMIACEIVYATGGYPDFAIIRAERKMEGRIALPLLPSEEMQRSDTVYAAGISGKWRRRKRIYLPGCGCGRCYCYQGTFPALLSGKMARWIRRLSSMRLISTMGIPRASYYRRWGGYRYQYLRLWRTGSVGIFSVGIY